LIDESRRRAEPGLRSIAEARVRTGDPQAVPVLVDLLQTAREDVRYAAAVALGRMGDSRAVEALQKVRGIDPRAFARAAENGRGHAGATRGLGVKLHTRNRPRRGEIRP